MVPDLRRERWMRHLPSDEAIGEVEKLVSELRAIRHWDTEYWRQLRPEWHETVAFVARQKRRSEIIRDLLSAAGHGGTSAVAQTKQPTRGQSQGQKKKFEYA
jgi:hypothetical protein